MVLYAYMRNNNPRVAKIFADIVVLGALLAGNVALATTSATVSATVTLQNVSVTVADGSVSYGILAVDTTKTTLAGGLSDAQTATNAGNVAEDLSIKGQDSSDWTLNNGSPGYDGTGAGVDTYLHEYCTGTCGTEGTPIYNDGTGLPGNGGTSFTPLTTSYQFLGSNIANSGTKTFNLLVHTPTSSTHYTSQSVDVTVLAVAH